MLVITLCDDNEIHRESISRLIKDILVEKDIEEYTIYQYGSGTELLEHEDENICTNLFLIDIDMPDINGMDLVNHIKALKKDAVVAFVTAYDEYAIDGYELGVFRYIVKHKIHKQMPECINAVLKIIDDSEKKIKLKFIKGSITVSVNRIVYIESNEHKLIFHMMDGAELEMYNKLDEMEIVLKEYGFIRVHQSFLVNVAYIKTMTNYKAKLKNGDSISIPRNRFSEIREEYYKLIWSNHIM